MADSGPDRMGLRSVAVMSFKHPVARKNPKSRYKTGAERTLAQLMLEMLRRFNYI